MEIQVHSSDVDKSDALYGHVRKQVEHALRHYPDRFTRVDVHIHDDNATKSGANDKRCGMEARPRSGQSLIVEATGDDFYKVVSLASNKLERVARDYVEKSRRS